MGLLQIALFIKGLNFQSHMFSMLPLPLIICDLDLYLQDNISVLNIILLSTTNVPNINFLSQQMKEEFVILAYHTGQCKRTGGYYNELVVAFLRTGDGLKGKKIYTC